MFAGVVVHVCQPPVAPTARLPIDGEVALSRWTSISPLTPPDAPEATRTLSWDSGVVPNLTLSNRRASPFPMPVTSLPPPRSWVVSTRLPLAALAASAWIVEVALNPAPEVAGAEVGGVDEVG